MVDRRGAWKRRRQAEGGAISVMSAGALFMLIGCCGMALEFSQIYNRRVELYAVAKVAALAAARSLNGTASGIDTAVSQARDAIADLRYQYGKSAFEWNDGAIGFADTPDSNAWLTASAARAAPRKKYFVRIDAAQLGADAGILTPVLLPVVDSMFGSVSLTDIAVAGRTSIEVFPMALCAMSATANGSRSNVGATGTSTELVEYGFRRGISYDLMRLNPNGSSALNYVVDPYHGPGYTGPSVLTSAEAVRPFVCSGRVWLPGLLGGTIKVAKPFPLNELFEQVNSRFDSYNGAASERCDPHGAPPDVNVKQYSHAANVSWMRNAPTLQAPPDSGETGVLRSAADLPAMPSGHTAEMYGPLWAASRPVPFSAYIPGKIEPAAGYTTYGTSQWGLLYKPVPLVGAYPTPTPYMATSGDSFDRPSVPNRPLAQRGRRFLNIPLLSCSPAAPTGGSAEVLAVARFFMTVPATGTTLYAEFAGVLPQERINGTVELFK